MLSAYFITIETAIPLHSKQNHCKRLGHQVKQAKLLVFGTSVHGSESSKL
jgi:hypothetical protein